MNGPSMPPSPSGELRVLGEAFQEAVEAGPVLVVVSGEAGVGKSRLLREFASRVRPVARVVRGRCVEQLDGVVPFVPFAAIVRDLVRAAGLGRHPRGSDGPAAAAAERARRGHVAQHLRTAVAATAFTLHLVDPADRQPARQDMTVYGRQEDWKERDE